jgi:hypothetical protein
MTSMNDRQPAPTNPGLFHHGLDGSQDVPIAHREKKGNERGFRFVRRLFRDAACNETVA